MKVIIYKKYLIAFMYFVFFTANLVCVASVKMPKLEPTKVAVSEVKQIKWQRTIITNGNLSAFTGTTLSATSSGRITKIFFQSGKMINQGQSLLQIYPNILQAQLAEAQATLKFNQITYNRTLSLEKNSYASKQLLDSEKANLDTSKYNVAKIQAQLKEYLIKAPFSGKIGLRLVNVGQYVAVGTPLVELQDLSNLRVEFDISSKYIPLINTNTVVQLSSNIYPNRKFNAKIYATSSSIDNNTRMLHVRAKLSNTNNLLLPGDFVQVSLKLQIPHKVLVIPANAVQYSENGTYVYTIDKNNNAKKVAIKIGAELPNNQIIVHGLQVSENIITEGQLKLDNGSAVQISQKR